MMLEDRLSTVTTGFTVTLARGNGAAGAATPEATGGLVAPRPARYITRYSPGLAGLALVTSDPFRCCALMWAPFWMLGCVGPSKYESTPGAFGTISSVMGSVRALLTLSTMGSCSEAVSSAGSWTLSWSPLKKNKGACASQTC